MPRKYMNFIAPAICLAIAALSFFLIAGIVTKVEFHASTIASLDESKKTVGELIAASTAASTAITILPGDTATPIAEKLADCSSYFLIVMCAIYLEKFMLTIAGFLSFKVLIPAGCLLLAIACVIRNRIPFRNFGARLIAIGLAIFLLVPISVRISDMIRDTYGSTITEAVSSALNAADDLETEAEEETEEGASEEVQTGSALPSGTEEAGEEKTGGLGGVLETITGLVGGAADTVTQAGGNLVETLTTTAAATVEKFENALNNMIEALAVMIVTSCIIPILVMLLFIWLIKSFLGLPIGMPPGFAGMGMPHDRV